MTRNDIILLIDDNEDNRILVSRMLKKKGIDTITADSGKKALSLLEKMTPDLILLDYSMPEMDGIELCRILKATPNIKLIPVIFLSGNNSSDLIVKGLEAGAVDYISFPFQESEIIARIKTHLKIFSLEKENENQLNQIQKLYQLMQDDLDIARVIQKTIVESEFPKSDDYTITSYYKPVSKVGGDLISYHQRNDGSIDFFFGDISGHGISAALLSGMYVLAFDISSRFDSSPKELLFMINDMISKFSKNFYLSAILARYFPASKKIVYSYAGHHPMYLFRDEKIISLPGKGMPLNLVPEIILTENSFQLKENDKLFLFSDGLFEFWNDEHEIFGLDAFFAEMDKFIQFNGKEFLEKISNEMFTRSKNDIRDDVSMLLLEI